ncbi:MAG: hypothetical protein KGL74_09860 [Elusimicrobia bacterium]|nr:hypothetical protein [Elusimicrobiota bacterium]MDE2511416.1 hypothetical protein [Elusimicrobiota bacterium]
MKTLFVLLALCGAAGAQTAPAPAVPPEAPKIEPRWKVKFDETPAQRINGLLPSPDGACGPRRGPIWAGW